LKGEIGYLKGENQSLKGEVGWLEEKNINF